MIFIPIINHPNNIINTINLIKQLLHQILIKINPTIHSNHNNNHNKHKHKHKLKLNQILQYQHHLRYNLLLPLLQNIHNLMMQTNNNSLTLIIQDSRIMFKIYHININKCMIICMAMEINLMSLPLTIIIMIMEITKIYSFVETLDYYYLLYL